MFFKSIEIFGFKSFAEKVKLEFQPGVTSIIGPNGCGKTNVVDATKWVLGAQSAKQLRGNRMEDVIFNGSKARRPLSMAEVSLSFDNTQHMLPIDFDEVTVTRRLYRSGESEYFINRAACRLKDITELFMDTGLGVDAYSLMEQNKIDFILNSKPEERRSIFEEAAGIMKYKTKKDESLRKLEQTNGNLMRISDIIGEIKKQINSLDYQVRKARQYNKNKDRIKSLELKHLCQDHAAIESDIASNNKILEDVSDRVEVLNTHINKKDSEISGSRLSMQEKEEAIAKTQEHVFALSANINRAEDRIQMGEERKCELGEQIEALEEDIRDILCKTEEIDKSFSSMEESGRSLDADILSRESSLKAKELELEESLSSMERLKLDIRERTEEHIDLKGRITQINAQIENLKLQEKSSRARRERLCRDEEVINEDRKQVSLELEEKSGQFNRYTDKVKELSEFKQRLSGVVENSISNERLKRKFSELHSTLIDMSRLVSEYDEITDSMIEYVRKDVSHAKANDDRFEEKVQPVLQEKHSLEKKIVEGAREIEELGKILETVEKEIDESKASISRMEADSIALEEKVKVVREEITELKIVCTRSRERKSNIESEVRRAHEEKNNSIILSESKKKTISDIIERIKEIDKNAGETKEAIAGYYNQQNEINASLRQVQEEKQAIFEGLRGEEALLSTLRRELASIQANSEKDRIKDTQLQMQMAHTIEKFSNDYNTVFEDAVSSFQEEELKSTEGREQEADTISKLKRQIESMGAVNLAAPEEYAKLDERYKFLKTQEDDLVTASDDLKKVISKINATSRENFEKTFNQVRNNFRVIFTELFEGGEADILLSNSEDMLTSGIDIVAQPPGKKLQNISLLSGGERALCAIALLFSIFQVKPSPFCILDEIDAPLDDSNLERFKNMLRKFTEKSQFIMITHNKKTMEMADVLYGVTMEEFGVSNIISVKFKKTAESPVNEKEEEKALQLSSGE